MDCIKNKILGLISIIILIIGIYYLYYNVNEKFIPLDEEEALKNLENLQKFEYGNVPIRFNNNPNLGNYYNIFNNEDYLNIANSEKLNYTRKYKYSPAFRV